MYQGRFSCPLPDTAVVGGDRAGAGTGVGVAVGIDVGVGSGVTVGVGTGASVGFVSDAADSGWLTVNVTVS